jgi:hypothetical protein
MLSSGHIGVGTAAAVVFLVGFLYMLLRRAKPTNLSKIY